MDKAGISAESGVALNICGIGFSYIGLPTTAHADEPDLDMLVQRPYRPIACTPPSSRYGRMAARYSLARSIP
jgi:hypothetical protein